MQNTLIAASLIIASYAAVAVLDTGGAGSILRAAIAMLAGY